jgi:oxygen-independent coproporphyrinogen-3 oxidase
MSQTGIYVHWPYCSRICPYCDFNVYRARDRDPAPLLNAMIADLEAHAARFGTREIVSLFLGGGTPSLLSGGDIAKLIDAAAGLFSLAPDCEITLESNPEDALGFADQQKAGVNRFSIGVQALDDAALKKLGRAHDVGQALRAVDAAASTGARVSLDMIYAREGQSVADWRVELARACALPAEHLSLYQLTIEDGTAFARKVARKQLTPPGETLAADLYEATQEVCEAAGFPAYEISNHARSDGARSRHNALYWRSQDWIGIGPGAHGRLTHAGVRIATEAHDDPNAYAAAVSQDGVGWSHHETLDARAVADEFLLMGLRIKEGLAISALEILRGAKLDEAKLAELRGLELIEADNGFLRLSKSGRLLANRVALELS